MNSPNALRLMILGIAVSLISAIRVNAQIDQNARWIPNSANALVIVRAKEIFETEIARKERWKTDRLKAFQSGATFLPPTTQQLLMSAQLDYEYMEPIWQVAVFEKSGSAIDILEVSKRVRGNLEKFDDKDAVLLPNDTYLVKLDENTLGTMTPANRQVTARWLRSQQFGSMKLSPYLTQAVKFAENNADVIVAFDFTDVLHPDVIKDRVKASGICKDDQVDDVSNTLATIQGLTLGITINDKITGAIKIDFTSSPANLATLGKQLLLFALKKNGVMIDDFENWEMKVDGNQLRMMGPLSSTGLRQIGTLIENPLAPDFEGDHSAGANQPDMKTCSLQYFGSIQTLFGELRKKDFQAMTTYSKFFDKYAREIDNLSVLNVDPAVLSYGAYVADSMRSASASLMDINLQKVRDRQTYSAGSSNYHGRGDYTNWNGYTSRYGWGYSSYNQDMRNRQRVTGEANLQGEIAAKEIMRDVETKTAEVRRQMSEKYQVDF